MKSAPEQGAAALCAPAKNGIMTVESIMTIKMTSRLAAGFLSIIASVGCASSNLTEVVSTPSDATITVDGAGDCQTPCTIEVLSPIGITVAKTGYAPQRMYLSPGGKRVNVKLELAAPTEEVDEAALPDL
ncbi:MAG: PEGA domain-containing protein [Pseudomonadota bacterium]